MSADDEFFKYLRACAEKQARGVEHYGEEFVGDVLQEYQEEQEDSKNYLDEMLLTGIISQPEYDHAMKIHFEAWWWVEKIRERR